LGMAVGLRFLIQNPTNPGVDRKTSAIPASAD
jgi:hypothetical protein